MQMFTLDTGWDAARADLRHTIATTRAAGGHEAVRGPLTQLLTRWTALEAQRVAAEDALADSNTAVSWISGALDRALGRFAVQLTAACDNDRAGLTFRSYFAERPSDVQALALEAKVERLEKWRDVRKKFPLEGAAAEALVAVDGLLPRATAALDERKRATASVNAVSLDMKAWREEANLARRAAEVALDQYANENRLDRAYSADFFPKPKRKAKPKADAKKADAPAKQAARPATDVLTKPPPPPAATPAVSTPPARPSIAPVN